MHKSIVVLAVFALICWSVAEVSAEGRKLAVVVGVNAYRSNSGLPNLRYAASDAKSLSAALRQQGYTVFELTHERAREPGSEHFAPNVAYIRDQIEGVLRYPNLGADDAVLISLHGHGVQFEQLDDSGRRVPQFFFCPADATITGVKTANELSASNHLLPLDEIYAQLGECTAATKLLVVDACRNDPTQPEVFRSALASSTLPKLPPPPGGTAAFFSCRAEQRAVEDPELNQGVFTYFIVQGLQGRADQPREGQTSGDGIVTLAELSAYVANNTYAHVYEKYNVRQSPELRGDFDLNLPLASLGSHSTPRNEMKLPNNPTPPPSQNLPQQSEQPRPGQLLNLLSLRDYPNSLLIQGPALRALIRFEANLPGAKLDDELAQQLVGMFIGLTSDLNQQELGAFVVLEWSSAASRDAGMPFIANNFEDDGNWQQLLDHYTVFGSPQNPVSAELLSELTRKLQQPVPRNHPGHGKSLLAYFVLPGKEAAASYGFTSGKVSSDWDGEEPIFGLRVDLQTETNQVEKANALLEIVPWDDLGFQEKPEFKITGDEKSLAISATLPIAELTNVLNRIQELNASENAPSK